MYVQKQHWEGSCDRILIVDHECGGSVQIDILVKNAQKERYRADCLLWALWVDESQRGQCVGEWLIFLAEKEAVKCGCKSIALEWSEQESPYWVRSWYERLGYDEKVFGKGYSLMVKNLE